MDECQGGHMSRWTSGFVDVCQVYERRNAECRVDECLGTLTYRQHPNPGSGPVHVHILPSTNQVNIIAVKCALTNLSAKFVPADWRHQNVLLLLTNA